MIENWIVGAFIFFFGILVGSYFTKGAIKESTEESIKEVKRVLKIGQKGYIVDMSEPVELTPIEDVKEETIK